MSHHGISRRGFLTASIVVLAPAVPIVRAFGGDREIIAFESAVDIVEFTDDGVRKGIVRLPKVVKTDEALAQAALTSGLPRRARACDGGSVQRGLLGLARQRRVQVRLLRNRSFRIEREVRHAHRVAELLATDCQGERSPWRAE
jgi:hypothetical protein